MGIKPVICNQIFVTSVFYYTSVLDYIYLVRMPDGRKPVCDDQRSAAGHKARQGLLHKAFALGVEG